MARNLDAATAAAQLLPVVRPGFLVRLEIDGDPLFAWSGLGSFNSAGFADAKLIEDDPATGLPPIYRGMGALGKIGTITDTDKGSRGVKLELSGVSLAEPELKQIVFESRKWQFRKGYIFMVNLDADNAVIGEPFRVRSGRMENMKIVRGNKDGISTITMDLVGYSAYLSEPLFSRYSEQKDLDATDTSQDYVHDLANYDPSSTDGSHRTSGGGGAPSRDPRNFQLQ